MDDPGDLIDKTDAFLGRYRGGTRPGQESDIPVLTDIVGPLTPPLILPAEITGTVQMPEAGRFQSSEIREEQLVEEVLRLLAPHIESALGDPLRDRLDQHLRRALSALTGQVRIDIETLVRVAVSQAVERALSDNNRRDL